MPTLFSILTLTLALVTSLPAQDTKPPSPAQLCETMKQGLQRAKLGSVALRVGKMTASAIVISPDGIVITAAHVASRVKEGQPNRITYKDGTTAAVEVLGWNVETDIGVCKITTPSEKPWPHTEAATEAPLTDSFCFTYAHPSGLQKSRPAQLRIGRIVSHSVRRGKTGVLTADCNIQPGDSGGGLFSLEGKLIGINSTAAKRIGFNLFPAIDQYHLDQKKLLSKQRWGDPKASHGNPDNLRPKITREVLEKMQTEMTRRLKIQYPPALDFFRNGRQPDGSVKLDQRKMIQLMTRDAIFYALGQPVSLGLDDPALTQQLKPLPKEHTQPVAIYHGKKRLCYGLPLSPQLIITKATLLKAHAEIMVHSKGKTAPATLLITDAQWDLAIVQIKGNLPLTTVQWPSEPTKISAGDLITAPDHRGRPLWGNAMDTRRAVSKKLSPGPVDPALINKHRGPYPIAIRHALPLYAADAGTPVFDADNHFVGMHIARFSRTTGLIIPAEKLQAAAKVMLEKKPAQ